MPPKSTNYGVCALCGERASKTKMPAHVEACAVAHDQAGPTCPLVVLRFGQSGERRYWPIVEARVDAQLADVDALLREVWLECCGHMSAFRAGRRELPMSTAIARAFAGFAGKLDYDYDFGNTTSLVGELVGSRQGSIGPAPVRLIARNEALLWSCGGCEVAATWVCPYCLGPDGGLFCDAHAEEHEHADEEVYLPVVNSPRMGVCGYAG